ncbi:conserved hypothetical protein [Flavobacterium psychrophilum]|uniref:hypothetical protein n=1 Tax=Flavobacterium psychrophilum TaxID=96345 RepID=UPI000B7C23DB|nr:hypothetical protein [Flavobacterium psychrophilum]SNB15552.1 conserved hypothetical protein [Flavobacterium psychrophilum]
MVDFIKIIIKDLDPAILEANPLLDFYDNINLSTGEFKTMNRHGNKITPCKNAMFNGLEFIIYETGTVILSGSLHKYWNAGAHNYNDFNYSAFLYVIKDLNDKFNIKSDQCDLKCLEIGINIVPPIPTNEILDNCLLHKTKPFEYQKNSGEGKYKQVQHSQYIIKIYNKALHYKSKGVNVVGEIMRFEIKYTKMQKLNERGIFTLRDLANYGLHNFKNELLNEWQNVLFYDNTIQIDPLSTKLKRAVLEYSNPNYWTGLLANNQTKNFTYHKNQLKKITFENSNKIQDLTAEIIGKKIDFLNSKTIQIDPLTIQSKRIVLDNSNNTKNTLCKVTGFNIEMQKNDSVLLSHTGLKYYYKTDKKIFEQLKRKYLSKKWHKSNFEIQIKELAHNIRNANSNQTIKQKRIYKPQQINLLNQFKINLAI